jgi:hypothetical protein
MDGLGYRGSLARAPSGYTPEQLSDNQRRYEERLYRERGKIVIDETDCGDNVIVLAWFKGLAKWRFG